MDEKKAFEAKIPIEWYVPEDLKTQYATNLVVQFTGQEFLINYFEMNHPIILGGPQEAKSKLEELGKLRATCVARIAVSPQRMKNFVKAMQDNLALHDKTPEKEGEK